MHILLVIGLGGFIGAILRYLVSGWVQNGFFSFPAGTLCVNVVGSFFLSTILYLSENKGFFSEETRIFLTIGILGAFTTMSTFSYESFRLLENKETLYLSINIIATVLLTLFAVMLGKIFVLSLWRS
ncbi:MAG: camphor resistance protein CrcB [Candidatus Methanofastidiosum methylothiophilum]|jgi:CrcB protein|uniref:Fluoride-specific ion channel FluC n=1 Tax=Candidatus Methanofastidiosum methylothiophilum TaxID=1705564 RepID=A0A150JBJ8_9EURY|nr:MAG: camphor resistance protein CrcB [Candidatus Methanofastidiosum methylthiophilus]NMC77206.1 fluoride efflux transporter CrcB [Candidatus Methanofastidiosa archaeon]